jgi:hypothetical protein
MADAFVRIELDVRRKLRYKHKDLRDVCEATKKDIGQLFNDPFNGWPYLLLYGLRWQDLKLTLDKCSEFIDLWVERHQDEKFPMQSMGSTLLEALNASGFIRIEAEGTLKDDDDKESAEGKTTPESLTR